MPQKPAKDVLEEAFWILAKLLVLMRLSAYILACYAIIQGTLIILGGPARFSQLGYRTAMLVPQAPASWGWVLGACGVIAFVGIKNRMYMFGFYGMFVAGIWSFAFGGAFFISALQYPEANLTAIVAYGKDGVLFLMMAMAHRSLARAHTVPEIDDA